MYSQIYSRLSLIFVILQNFRVAGAKGFFFTVVNIVFFYPIGKKVTLGPLFIFRTSLATFNLLRRII